MASSSRINPGEKGSIEVAIDVQHYNGKVSKEIVVYSNDPAKPRTVLRLEAEIR